MIHQIDDTPYYAVVKAQICWKNVGVAFIRKWRLRHRPVAGCLEEAGDRLFTFTRLPRSQWRGARTTNAIKFARRVQAPDSKRRPYCHLQILRRCCSGRCSPLVRSTCVRSTAGGRLQENPLISQLISLHDLSTLEMPEIASPNSNTNREGTGNTTRYTGLAQQRFRKFFRD